MAAGLKALRKIQLGKETNHGVAVAATARLIGTLGMALDMQLFKPEDQETGLLSSFMRSYPAGYVANLPFESDANYEQLMYMLAMTIIGGVAPTGAGPYVWTYSPNLSSANNPDSFTIEYGDDVQAFESAFCYGKDLGISGMLDEAVKVKSALVGKGMDTTTFTGALTNPLVLTPVLTNTGKFYMDTTFAGIGVTQKTATLVDFDWKLSEGITPIKYVDGNLGFTDRAEKKRHVELNLTLAFDTSALTLFTAFKASPQTASYVALKFTGPAITGGTDGLILQGCFTVAEYPTIEERDGQDVVKLKLTSQYDATSGKEWEVILTNAVATLV